MCGRYLLSADPEALARWFGTGIWPDFESRFNIAPSQTVPVVMAAVDGTCEVALVRWGLIPRWSKDRPFKASKFNARAEDAALRPAFREAFARRRCLVPASGFYEWKKVGKGKQPYVIRPTDGNPIAFAGLWERWQDGGEAVESLSILTTEANDLLKPIHERMPVILKPEHYSAWLDARRHKPESLLPMLVPYPDEELTIQRVSSWVSNAKHEGERCLASST